MPWMYPPLLGNWSIVFLSETCDGFIQFTANKNSIASSTDFTNNPKEIKGIKNLKDATAFKWLLGNKSTYKL